MTGRVPQPESDAALAELLAEVRRIEVQSRRMVTDVVAGGWASVFRGSGIEFERVREYVPGDDPRRIDAHATQRWGRPFVRTYVDEREQPVWFVLDLSASMLAGFGALSARQMAARVGACLAFAAVRNDDKVGLLAFGGTSIFRVEPRKGLSHVLRIVRDMLALPTARGGTRAGDALAMLAGRARRHAVVFVLSDFFDPPDERAWALAARHHDLVAVRIEAPEESDPPRVLLDTFDPESDRRRVLDFRHAGVRAAHARRRDERRAANDAVWNRAGVDRIEVPVPRVRHRNDVAGPILSFFHMRQARGAKR